MWQRSAVSGDQLYDKLHQTGAANTPVAMPSIGSFTGIIRNQGVGDLFIGGPNNQLMPITPGASQQIEAANLSFYYLRSATANHTYWLLGDADRKAS